MSTPIKPGIKTSEFWLSILAVALGSAMGSGLIPVDTPWAKVAGILAAVLGSLGYAVSRGIAKSGTPALLPLLLVAGLGLGASGCDGMTASQKNMFKAASFIAAAGAETAAKYGWQKAREGCKKLETKDAQDACILGVDLAEAMAKAVKAQAISDAATVPAAP